MTPAWRYPGAPRAGVLLLAGLCLLAGGLMMSQAALIRGKAWLGPILLHHAWVEAQATGQPIKPWSWADIRPVARLQVSDLDIDTLVLNDSSGEALAWGPGLWQPPDNQSLPGTTVLTGHRDTHFAFLQHVKPGMALTLTRLDKSPRRYRIEHTEVFNIHDPALSAPGVGDWLLLVTCYPFKAIDNRTSQRYAVWARRVP